MVLRSFLRNLVHNEYIVNKLAESKLFKRVAQLTIVLFYRMKGSKVARQISSDPQKFNQQTNEFLKRFYNNLQKGINEGKRNEKK